MHYELWDVDAAKLVATAKTQDLMLTSFLDIVQKKDPLFIKCYYVTVDNVRTYIFSGEELDLWRDDYETSRLTLQVNYHLSDVGLRDYLEQNGFSVEIEDDPEAFDYFDLGRYIVTLTGEQGNTVEATGANRAQAVIRAYLAYRHRYTSLEKEDVDEKRYYESIPIRRKDYFVSP